jgi:opacity protein-like surface antigen
VKSTVAVLLGIAALIVAPASASAQGYLTGFVGGNFGGDSGVSLDESIDDTSRLNFGVRLGVLGGGIFGGEIDVGYTPDFYGKGTVFDSSGVLTVMGNVVVGLPLGPVRPYFAGGIGLIRRTVTYAPGEGLGSVTDSRAAYSLGGGVNLFVSEHIGINADLRYFRNFSSGNSLVDLPDDKFNFARGSVGLTIRF